ncbi:BlaI/MecI/CopY family transcriptional regulator [Carnobacterium mobile]|uniref:BlaI/MecI/CopY family transcriptional regulator n=1 Tax=Carnobacterium mobile TaxID=2750 RepID=UPI002458906C|nr:BlaI/MecI/CopY family transcriptional regulator [Carnobacterium mobile]
MKGFTKREKEIMDIFWNSDFPLNVSDIEKVNPSLSKNTIQSIVRKLNKRNIISVDKIDYSGTVLARYYKPTISQEEYLISELSNDSLSNLFATFIDKEATQEELNELEQLIKEKKQQTKDV